MQGFAKNRKKDKDRKKNKVVQLGPLGARSCAHSIVQNLGQQNKEWRQVIVELPVNV